METPNKQKVIDRLSEVKDDLGERQTKKVLASLKITPDIEEKIDAILFEHGIKKTNAAYEKIYNILHQDESFVNDFLGMTPLDLSNYINNDSLFHPKDIYQDLANRVLNGNVELCQKLFEATYLEGMITRGLGEIALALMCQDAKLLSLGGEGDIEINSNHIEIKHCSNPQSSSAGRLSNDSGGTGNNGRLKNIENVLKDLREYLSHAPISIFRKDLPTLPDKGIKLEYTKGSSLRLDKWLMGYVRKNLSKAMRESEVRKYIVDTFIFSWENFFIDGQPIIREIIENIFVKDRKYDEMIEDNMSVIPTERSEEFGKYMLSVYLVNYLKSGSLLAITKKKNERSQCVYMDSSLIAGKSVYEVFESIKDSKLGFGWPSLRKSSGKCVRGGVFVRY